MTANVGPGVVGTSTPLAVYRISKKGAHQPGVVVDDKDLSFGLGVTRDAVYWGDSDGALHRLKKGDRGAKSASLGSFGLSGDKLVDADGLVLNRDANGVSDILRLGSDGGGETVLVPHVTGGTRLGALDRSWVVYRVGGMKGSTYCVARNGGKATRIEALDAPGVAGPAYLLAGSELYAGIAQGDVRGIVRVSLPGRD